MIGFKINSKTLLSILKEVVGVIPSKPAYSILGSLLFRLSDGEVLITSSDSESVMSYRIQNAEVSGEGLFCIDAKRCLDIMKSVPNCTVEFSTDGKELSVFYPNGKFKLAVSDGNEYPRSAQSSTPIFQEDFDAPDMVKGFEHTLFAASTDTLRPVMMAICIDVTEDSMAFVSSDTHVLSYYKVISETPRKWVGKILIGQKAATILTSLIRGEKKVSVALYDNAIEFSTDFMQLRTKTVKGTYPNYLRVFPDSYRLSGSVGLDSFSSAVRRVSLTGAENALLECLFSNGAIDISGRNSAFSTSATEKIPCVWESSDLRIGINAEHLKKVLSSMSSATVRIQANAPENPIVLIPTEDDKNVEWMVLMMPMQIV